MQATENIHPENLGFFYLAITTIKQKPESHLKEQVVNGLRDTQVLFYIVKLWS